MGNPTAVHAGGTICQRLELFVLHAKMNGGSVPACECACTSVVHGKASASGKNVGGFSLHALQFRGLSFQKGREWLQYCRKVRTKMAQNGPKRPFWSK